MLNGHDRDEALHRLKQNVRDQIERHRQENYALGKFRAILLLIIVLCFISISFLILALK